MGLDFTELLDVAALQQDFSIDLVERLYSQLDEIVEQDLAEVNQQDLVRLFLVAQHVMKSKDDQLSVTMEELEHRAEMAGETEELRLENTRLQALLNRGKTKEIDAAALVELQESNDVLKKEVKTRQKQLDEEKRETDKLLMRVEELESERRELRRQVEQLKENIEDIRSTYENKSSDAEEGAGLHSYTELLRQKNQHISTLLDDVEAAEKEGGNLREMTESLQSKLSEATSQMNIITAEFQLIKSQQLQQPAPDPDASAALVEDLRAQLSDACALKSRRDAQFDQLTAVVEQRSDELRQLIQQRDAEIDRLTEQLKHRSSQEHQGGGAAGGDESVQQLRRRVQEAAAAGDRQRRQITELEGQLRRAAAEMDATAQLLEQTQTARSNTSVSASYRDALLPLRTELTRAESQITQLQDGQHKLETLAAEKDQEISSLTRRLTEVMEGEFGLSEAVAEIRQCQKQLQVREQQLSEQNGHVNLVQGHLNVLLEENTALRKRLGIGPHEAARLTGQDAGREQLVHVLEREVEKLEEERIALKLENRKLSSQIRTGTMTGLTPDEIRQVCKQRKQFWISVKQQTRVCESAAAAKPLQLPGSDLFERCAQLQTELSAAGEQLQLSERAAAQLLAENDRLRNGMREILDSIKLQDASSVVKLSAPSLETLLSALDTRRLVGEYHPSLVPYSTLQQLEGRNEELRDQLKLARSELAAARGVHSLSAAPSTGNITGTSAAATSSSDILHTPASPAVASPAAAADLQLAVLVAVTAVTDTVTADDDDDATEDEVEMDGQLVSARLAEQLLKVCASGDVGPSLESQIDRLNAWYCAQRRRQRHVRQQHEQTALRWQQTADQLESTEAEVETLRAQLSQADLYRTTVLTSGEELRHGVARLHRQMALRVNQLVRVERQLRCTHAQCERLEQQLAACQQRLDRTKCRAAGNTRQLTAENKSLQLQLAACRRQLASTEAGGGKPDTGSVESDDADKLADLQKQLMTEESASSRLQAELMQMRRVMLVGEGAASELEDSSVDDVKLLERQRQRTEHAEKMSGLLREQLDASEGRCQQLERQIGELAAPAANVKRRLLVLLDQLTDDVKAADGGDTDDGGDVSQRLLTAERDRDAAQDTAQLLTDQLRRLRADQTDAAAVRLLYGQMTAEIANTSDARSSVVSLQLQLLESQRMQRQQLQRLQTVESELQTTETRLCRSEEDSGQLRVRFSQLQATHARQRGRMRTAVCQLRSCLAVSSRPARCLLVEHVAELLVRRQQLAGIVRDERAALASVQEERDALRLKRRVFDETLATLTGADESTAAADSLRVAWVQKYQTAALLATEQRLRADRCSAESHRLRAQLSDEESRVTAAETAVCRLQNQLEEDSSAGQQLQERVTSVDRVQLTVESSAPVPQQQLRGEEEAMSVTAASTPTPLSTRRSVVASTPQPALRSSAAEGGGDCFSDVPPAGWSSAVQGWLSVHGSRLNDAICWLQQHSHQSPGVSINMTTSSGRLQALITGAASPFDIVADLLHVYADVTGVLMQQQAVAVVPAAVAPSIAISDQQMAPLLRRVRLAEDAAQALRQRLQQKEQLVDQLRRQPDQSRDLLNQLSDQLEQSEAKRRQQSTLLSTLRSELAGYVDRQRPVAAAGNSQEHTARRLQRLGESEQLLAEQERAIGALMERLRQSRSSESRLKENVLRLETDLQALSSSSGARQSQPGHDIDGVRVATEERAPERIPAERESSGAVTSRRVKDRVLQAFTDWEKKHPRHKRLLDEIRTEVVRLVCESCVHVEDVAAATATASTTASTGAAAITEMDQLRQQLNSTQNQLNHVQSELNERTLRCHRLQSDVYEAERRRRDEAQTAQRRLQELKDRLTAAEQQLQLTSCRRQHDKQKIDDEVSRWDERKRLQKQALRLRTQLDEKLSSCAQLQSTAESLREMVRRLKRDKRLLETKLRSQPQPESALDATVTAAPAAAATDDVTAAGEQLVARDKLKQQVQSLAQKLARERTTARQLQLQLDSVSERDCQLTEMSQQLSCLRTDNQQLDQQLQLVREERDSAVAAAAAVSDRQLRASDSCPAAPPGSIGPAASSTTDLSPAGERGTISILRRLVERLRAENLRLRHRLMQCNVEVESHSQLELVRTELSRTVDERDRLSVSLRRLHESSPRQHPNSAGD